MFANAVGRSGVGRWADFSYLPITWQSWQCKPPLLLRGPYLLRWTFSGQLGGCSYGPKRFIFAHCLEIETTLLSSAYSDRKVLYMDTMHGKNCFACIHFVEKTLKIVDFSFNALSFTISLYCFRGYLFFSWDSFKLYCNDCRVMDEVKPWWMHVQHRVGDAL